MTGLILGSGSRARRQILSDAGLNFEMMRPLIDEGEVKQRLRARKYPVSGLPLRLAQEKALSLSRNYPGPLVIGADQILLHDNKQYDKPADMAAARQMLQRLRGDTHQLVCAVCVACGDDIVWTCQDRADLAMWDFPDSFLDRYLASAGDRVCDSVGAYQLESLGAQLFSEIRGDYFTILGLPLLPLLSFLRQYREYEVSFA